MDPNVRDVLDIVFRWVHFIAGIMWIGNSMLFNWLDRNLVLPAGAKDGSEGEIWMVHSGGFYQVEKKQLAPAQMPKLLHWFKWQAYTTWVTGFCLLGIVYYMGGGAFLVDPSVSDVSVGAAIGIALGALAGAFLLYDLLWRSPLRKTPLVAIAVSVIVFAAITFTLTRFLSGRAVYIHVGAMLGTVMAGNVFFHIIPSQRKLVAATMAGKPQDQAVAKNAKSRSIHNNYMTFPVLFMMVSNHFSSLHRSDLSWAILAVLIVTGGLVRHFMNIRFTFRGWIPALASTIAIGIAALFLLVTRPQPGAEAAASLPAGEHVSFSTVRVVISERCVPCHSANPTDTTGPKAPMAFDTADQIRVFAERIKTRAVILKTMPLTNKTGMTQEERDLIGRWFTQGHGVND